MKKIRILIWLLLIVNIVFLVSLLLTRQRNVQEGIKKDEATEVVEEYYSDKVFILNSYNLISKYKGNLSREYLYEHTYSFVNYLPKLYTDIKTMNNKQLLEYMNENIGDIKKYSGITKKDDFINLIDLIKKVDFDKDIGFKTATLDAETINDDGEYCNFNVKFEYSDNTKLNFKVRLCNREISNKPLLQFIPIKEAE